MLISNIVIALTIQILRTTVQTNNDFSKQIVYIYVKKDKESLRMLGDYYDPIFAKHLGSFLNWVNIIFFSLSFPPVLVLIFLCSPRLPEHLPAAPLSVHSHAHLCIQTPCIQIYTYVHL